MHLHAANYRTHAHNNVSMLWLQPGRRSLFQELWRRVQVLGGARWSWKLLNKLSEVAARCDAHRDAAAGEGKRRKSNPDFKSGVNLPQALVGIGFLPRTLSRKWSLKSTLI